MTKIYLDRNIENVIISNPEDGQAMLYDSSLPGWKNATISGGSFTGNHNDLTGLQGGTTDEYYHLTAAQLNRVNSPTISGVPQEVGFFSDTATLSGSPNFLYDDTLSQITLLNANGRTKIKPGWVSELACGIVGEFAGWGADGNLATPTRSTINNPLVRFIGHGYTVSGWTSSIAHIDFVPEEDLTPTSMATRIDFYITKHNNIAETLAFQVTQSGIKNLLTNTYITKDYTLTLTGNASVLGINTGDQTLSGLGGQPQLSGTGFVKASGTTISYDNTAYQPLSSVLTAFAALTYVAPSFVKMIGPAAWALDLTTYAPVNQTMYIGTTAHAINRASAAETLAGITGLTPGANFVLTQNSVAVVTSVEAGAVANTLYLSGGNVGIGTATSILEKLTVLGNGGIYNNIGYGSAGNAYLDIGEFRDNNYSANYGFDVGFRLKYIKTANVVADGYFSIIPLHSSIADLVESTAVMTFSSDKVGIGTNTPQTQFHVRQGAGNFGTWSGTISDGTTITIIIDGTNDVVSRIYVIAVVTIGGVAAPGYVGYVDPGSSAQLYNGGSDRLDLIVGTNGATGVHRYSGTATYQVSMFFTWI